MPKVPAAHLAERRRQILHAAMRLFADNGFHATSMHQVIAASGMSAGAVYHYFPTKQSLVEATGDAVQLAYRAPLGTLPPEPTPADLVEALCTAMDTIHRGEIDFTRIGIFLWAEALRDADARSALQRVQLGLRAALLPHIERWKESGAVDPAADPGEIAAAVYGLIPGYTLQLNLLGDVDPRGYARGATAWATPSPPGS